MYFSTIYRDYNSVGVHLLGVQPSPCCDPLLIIWVWKTIIPNAHDCYIN